MSNNNVLSIEDDAKVVEHAGSIIWNQNVDGAQSKRGGAKNATCIFCDTSLTGCSSSRAFAHILGRAVLAQKKANVGACAPIRKKDDNRYAEFKIAQKALNKEMMAKERLLSCSQAKQSVLDSIISSGKRTVNAKRNLLSQKHQTLLLQASFTKMLWRSMLLIHLVLQLWLISVSNSVNNTHTKRQIDAKLVVLFLNQHMKKLQLPFS